MGARIVDKGIKIDLHIHSASSSNKDGQLVKDGTIEHIQTLISKLKENEVDMFAITDHDSFDSNLYFALKEHEGVEFGKILPGIEFSVGIESGKSSENKSVKQVHVIAIFEDTSEAKINQLERLIKESPYDIKSKSDIKGNDLYSEKTFREILQKSDLNVCLIAHQKQSPISTRQKSPDVMALGPEKFNELINYEYFESYEFKTENSRIFHNLFKKTVNEKYERVRFITGSDCHVWKAYPKHDENDQSTFVPTFLKCLPSFRGLAMALTDDSRIQQNQNFFSDSQNYLPAIVYKENDIEHSIPLSKGINAIIGDNSKGKSMFLHALTGFTKENSGHGMLSTAKKAEYEKYLQSHDIEVITNLNSEEYDFEFDSQGEIRTKFENGSAFSSFFEDKKPSPTDSSLIVNTIKEEFKNLYDALSNKLDFDKKLKLAGNTIFKLDTCETIGLSLNVSSVSASKKEETKKLAKLISGLTKAKTNLGNVVKLGLDDVETINLKKIIEYLTVLIDKYQKILDLRIWNNSLIESINSSISKFIEKQKMVQSTAEAAWTSYNKLVSDFSNSLANIISSKGRIGNFEFSMEPIIPKYNEIHYGDLILINRFASNLERYDTNYCLSLLKRAFKANTNVSDFLKIPNLTEDYLRSIIKDKDESHTDNIIETLERKVDALISKDFANEEAIIENGADVTKNYSAGFNAAKYLNIMSYEDSNSIYIIDQPEDDISQKSIRETVVQDLKRMSKSKQIVLVTHNPQFVINLDADNVLYFHDDENGCLSIDSGALEFKDDQLDVLKCVSENLEGGIESLKKRWKRYEKNINNDF